MFPNQSSPVGGSTSQRLIQIRATRVLISINNRAVARRAALRSIGAMPPSPSFPLRRASVRALALSALFLGAQAASAGELAADRDAYVFGGDKPGHERSEITGYESNFGKRPLLELKTSASKSDGFTRKIYLGFDLSTLPRPLGSLSLRLNLREMNPGPGGDKILTEQPLKIYLLRPEANGDDWAEGSGTSAEEPENGAATGSIHWLNAPANTRRSGDRFTSADVIKAGELLLPIMLERNKEVLIPLSPEAVASLSSGRHGARATLMISIADGTDDLLRFHSREATRPAYRPALVW